MEKLNTVLKVVAVDDNVRFPFPDTEKVRSESIDALSLDVRCQNGLKRNGVLTIGGILDSIDNGSLSKFRSLGKKSVNKIMYELCAYRYRQLSEKKQKDYLMKIVRMNTV